MIWSGVIVLTWAAVTWIALLAFEVLDRRQRRMHAARSANHWRAAILANLDDIAPTPDHLIVAWTPEEREAFGINDTQRWIEETDKVLRPLQMREAARNSERAWMLRQQQRYESEQARLERLARRNQVSEV